MTFLYFIAEYTVEKQSAVMQRYW